MKTLEDLNIQFKEVEFICKCGKIQKEIVLVEGDYGFQTSNCENCGKRNLVEYDNGFVRVKSL